jgi:hypothetical protein
MVYQISRWAVVVLGAVVLSACSIGYNMDTPYDPAFHKGETLFDQIPNNTNGASTVCAGHLDPKDRQPHQSGRC